MNGPAFCRFCAVLKPSNVLYDLTCCTEVLEDVKRTLKLLNIDCVNFSDDALPKSICVACYHNLKNCGFVYDTVYISQNLLSELYSTHDSFERKFGESEIVRKRDDDTTSEDEDVDIEESSTAAQPDLAPAPNNPGTWSTYPIKCDQCGQTCKTILDLKEHCKSTHGQFHGFRCSDCQVMVLTFHAFVKHVRQHRPELLEHCPVCNIKTTDPNHINLHPESFLDQTMYVPPTQPVRDLSKFFGPRVRERVVVKSWKEYCWGCLHCSLEFTNQGLLRMHLKEVHTTCFGFKCMDCSAVIEKYEVFIKHVTSHQPALKKKCEYCDFALGDRIQYDLHAKQHKLDYECLICGEYFHDKVVLWTHKRMYKAIKPNIRVTRKQAKAKKLTCETCGLVCSGPATLRRHKITHAKNGNAFTCKTCGKTYTLLSTLKAHNLNVHQIEIYDCGECTRSFDTAVELQAHVDTHGNAKPYKCPHCPRRFRLNFHLQNHMPLHSDKMPYTCEMCNKGFKYKHALVTHERTHLKPYYRPGPPLANRLENEAEIPEIPQIPPPAPVRRETQAQLYVTVTDGSEVLKGWADIFLQNAERNICSPNSG